MKKLIALFVIVFVFSCVQVSYAESIDFIVEGGLITKYIGNDADVVIPLYIENTEIVGVDSFAFCNNSNIKHVYIEDGIEVIQQKAFYSCENLESVSIPESMLLVNDGAFYNCTSLNIVDCNLVPYLQSPSNTNDNILNLLSNENDTFIVENGSIVAYNGTESDIIIPSDLNGVIIKSIADSAFAGNSYINSLTLPDTVTTIGNKAFANCTSLTSIRLSSKLVSCGSYTFDGCISLKTVDIPGTLKVLPKYMFNGCSSLETVVLNEGTIDSGSYTFYGCSKLTNLALCQSLTKINTWCFGFCKLITTIDIPESVTFIGDAAFYYCNKLNNVILPSNTTYIGTHCFRECWALDTIKLPTSIVSLSYRTFHNCAFSRIDIPSTVTCINDEAFYNCKNLISLELPDSLTVIGKQAFFGCNKFKYLVQNTVAIDKIGTDIFGINKSVFVYAPEGSVFETYCQINDLEFEPLLSSNESFSTDTQLGLVITLAHPNAKTITRFGATCIPTALKDNELARPVDIAYDVEMPDMQVKARYMVLLTDIVPEAREWLFSFTPYAKYSNETYIYARDHIISINNGQ